MSFYYKDEYGDDSFTVGIGAEAIRDLLIGLDLEKLAENLRTKLTSPPQSLNQPNFQKIKSCRSIFEFRK